ncbi:MAG: chemotaxis protein CheR [Myxococcales bacterium]|nr:chemotaxis protein CheR [Myxococcales bacterium]MDH3483036.1 chemotaxis protein CheR [Myxococcales bacterium]
MKDPDCISFLQWALPRLQLRWPGYRKVRRQVCKRVDRRIRALGLDGVDAYRARLEADPAEWAVLDDLTRITISRFFRERDAFTYLCEVALPELHKRTAPKPVRIWSAGCAAGEEAYTLAIAARQQSISLRIVATDSDEHQLVRAREARYSAGCLKELPARWRMSAFEQKGDEFVLRDELRADVELLRQDIRRDMPTGPFHLILCRYLTFTYFDARLQHQIAERLLTRIIPNGFIALGKHESWPEDVPGLVEAKPGLRVYRKL